jgi:exopolyphosphatase/guanosine-5'-triphosphate,3'-diphosphate pyrophosphatase
MKTLAAIDIGTNSIKLLVANVEEDGTLDVVLREKEMVRLGSETLRTGVLSPEAIEAGASTVEHLAKLAHGSGAEVVRAVATCAVREATNSDAFVAAVKKRTGVRVDVISGEEEARLINLAVRSEFPATNDPLFLVDIGGGSTEFVVSNGTRVLLTESLPLGVVRLNDRHAKSDPPSDRPRRQARRPGGPQEGVQDLRRLVGHDPVAVARARGGGPRPRAEPDGAPDADPRRTEEGQPPAAEDEREGQAPRPGPRSAAT